MTPQERLKLYETALIDWKNRINMRESERVDKNMHHGFCAYFTYSHYVFIYDGENGEDNLKKHLPELSKQAPKNYDMFWFDYNDTQSRITCLENAIKLTKETYNL